MPSLKFLPFLLLAIFTASVQAAPWPIHSRHATHRIRHIGRRALKVDTYQPKAKFEVPNFIRPPDFAGLISYPKGLWCGRHCPRHRELACKSNNRRICCCICAISPRRRCGQCQIQIGPRWRSWEGCVREASMGMSILSIALE